MICHRLTFAVVVGAVSALVPLPVAASEKATITAPAVAPPKHTTSKSQVDSPSAFRSMKSGDSTGPILDASSLPAVPSIDPKAAKQMLQKLEKDRDWLLDDTGLDRVDTTKGLEDAWETEDPKAKRRSALERKLLGKENEPKSQSRTGDSADEAPENRNRTSRRGSGDFDVDDDLNRRSDALELRGFSAPGQRDLNPFEASSANSRDRADRAFGSQEGFIGGRPVADFESPFKKSDTDFTRRMDRLGLSSAEASGLREPVMRSETFGEGRQMRVDQFTQALQGNSALSGLNSAGSASATVPTFSTPTTGSSLFDRPGSDFSKSFTMPSLPTPAASRGFDLITAPRVSIQPLPKATF